MKILDCFPYFNEQHLLELRLRLLHDHVDKFIITEADHTFSGIPKPFTCRDTLEKLGLMSDKITIVELNTPSKAQNPSNHYRENIQRDVAANFFTQDTMAIVSDLDEIMDPGALDYFFDVAQNNPDIVLHVPMHHLSGKPNLYREVQGQEDIWCAGFICLAHHVQENTLSQIRENFSARPEDQKYLKFSSRVPHDDGELIRGGWHFTWMGGTDVIKTKFQSFEHCDDIISDSDFPDSPREMLKFMDSYTPTEGSTDALSRHDTRLRKFDTAELPLMLYEFTHIRDFLFGQRQNKIDHFYHQEQFGENWFTYPELYKNMVKLAHSGSRFVEVGSWKGMSSAFMATEIFNSGKHIEFFCVDTWEGSQDHQDHQDYQDIDQLWHIFVQNMKPVEGCYLPIRAESVKASQAFADQSLDFVFIDAEHTYEAVVADIQAWWPKVKPGGVLAGHDCYPHSPEYGDVYAAVSKIFDDFEVSEDCFIVRK